MKRARCPRGVDHVTLYRRVQRFTLGGPRTTASNAITGLLEPGSGPCADPRRSAADVVIRGHAFVQNLRRDHYELNFDTYRPRRLNPKPPKTTRTKMTITIIHNMIELVPES